MLQGQRVRLRAVEASDLPALHLFANDLGIELAGGGNPPMPRPLDDVAATLVFPPSEAKNIIVFVIEVESKAIGQIVIHGLNECHGVHRKAEIGLYIGDREFWGKGYGREAILLMLDYGFSCWNLNRIWLRTAASNVRAIKCYTGVGFVEEGRLRSNEWYQGAFNDTVVMGMLRTDWEALAPKG